MKTNWVFVVTFYFGGMAYIALGIDCMARFAGAGLFITLFGIASVFAATYEIKLPPEDTTK